MKKSLFGYNVSEVNTILDALREENKSLNSTITSLKVKIKNIDGDSNAKSIILEEDLKNYEENIVSLNTEKKDLKKKLNSLIEKYESSAKQIEELNNKIQYLHNENDNLLKQLSELNNKDTKDLEREVALTNDKNQDIDSFRKEIIRYMDDSLEKYQQLVNNNKLSESTKQDQ